MLWKFVSVAVLVASFGVTPAAAQSVRDLGGPAEQPPAGFKGQQYVDSRGCVFLRAGYGGQITWIPRVSRDRKQLCGYAGSGRQVEVTEAAPMPVPKQPVARTAPLDTVASIRTAPKIRSAAPAGSKVATADYLPAPVVVPAPRRQVISAPAPQIRRPATPTELAAAAPVARTVELAGLPVAGPASPTGLRLACPAANPVAQRFEMRGGGTKVMCTTGGNSLVGATFPRYVSGDVNAVTQGYNVYTSTKSSKEPGIPAGYHAAWKDDRLNVNRGRQTVQGVVDQDDIWTRTVPSELREGSTVKRKRLVVVVRPSTKGDDQAGRVVVSTKSVPQTRVGVVKRGATQTKAVPKAKSKGGALVQVGSFGVASNADGAASRLSGLGLPVVRSRVNRGGKALQIIYAGPFASAAEAQAALNAARGAGFGDAILR
ncbi:MAG: SPOR domain-containing protein [Pseudomonadota bacterium]